MKDDVFKAVKDLFCCCKNDEFTENECGMELRRSERSHSTTSVFGSSFRASFVTFKMPSLSGRNSVSESAVTEGNMKDGANNSSSSCDKIYLNFGRVCPSSQMRELMIQIGQSNIKLSAACDDGMILAV